MAIRARSFSGLLIAFLLWATVAPLQAEPRTRAFLVGIGDYQDTANWTTLKGAPGDVVRFRELLLSRFSVAPDQIEVLAQEKATKSAIEGGLLDLVKRSQPGDTVIFYYAGHGCAVPDREPLEPYEELDGEEDGLDECLVPVDAPGCGNPSFPDSVVRDDFVEDALARLVARVRPNAASGGSVVFIFDSCHSGTLSRSPIILGKTSRTGSVCMSLARKTDSIEGLITTSVHKAGDGWVLLSACRADQTAKEDSEHGGDFSFALAGVLNDSRLGPGSTYRELMALLSSVDVFVDQNPQAEGNLDLEIFGGHIVKKPPRVVVREARRGLVKLSAGTLYGLNPGSRVLLYPFDAKDLSSATPLGAATVLERGTDLFRATARLEEDVPEEKVRASQVVLDGQNFGPFSLKVYGAEGLEFPPWVVSVREAKSADVLAFKKGARLWEFQRARPGGLPSSELLRWADGDPLSRLTQVFKKEAKRLYLSKMRADSGRLKVDLQPGTFGDSMADFAPLQRRWTADGRLLLKDGAEALLSIQNRGQKPLYLSVLNFLGDGSVQVLYPVGLEDQRRLGQGETLGVDVTFWTEGLSAVEGFKVIGTREPVDFSFLTGKSAERTAGEDPFAELAAALGSGQRALRVRKRVDFVASEITWVSVQP